MPAVSCYLVGVRWFVVIVSALAGLAPAGCGQRSRPEAGRDADLASGRVPEPADAAPVVLSPRPLGLASPDLAGWRRRPGHARYQDAVRAEHRSDWPATIEAARAARALDPTHLEAAWLEAAAAVRAGRLDEVLAPLQLAASGDWGKWGEPSLVLPMFAAFRSTPVGQGWVALGEAYRARYREVLGRSLPLIVDGALLGYDPADGRWQRLTRHRRPVRAAVASDPGPTGARIAYLGATAGSGLRVGVVDLGTGGSGRELELPAGTIGRLTWREVAGGPELVLVRRRPSGRGDLPAQLVDWRRGELRPLVGAPGPVRSDVMVVGAEGVAIVRRTPAGISADWDDDGLAGALRLDQRGRSITAPGSSLIARAGLAWSPGQARLAFVAQPDDPCAPTARFAVCVADAASGRITHLLEHAAPPQLIWIDERRLLVSAGGQAELVEVGANGGPTLEPAPAISTSRLVAGSVFVQAAPRLACAPPATQDTPGGEGEDEGLTGIDPATASAEVPDAAVEKRPPEIKPLADAGVTN